MFYLGFRAVDCVLCFKCRLICCLRFMIQFVKCLIWFLGFLIVSVFKIVQKQMLAHWQKTIVL